MPRKIQSKDALATEALCSSKKISRGPRNKDFQIARIPPGKDTYFFEH